MYSIEGSRLKSNGDNIVYKARPGVYEHYSNLEREGGDNVDTNTSAGFVTIS